MEASTDFFINLIQNHRILYDKWSKDFKDNRKKDLAWVKIAAEAGMTVDSAKKRYNSLRQKYSREKRKCELAKRAKNVVSRVWHFYDRLHFLSEFVQPRSTFTNDTGFDVEDDNVRDMEIYREEANVVMNEEADDFESEITQGAGEKNIESEVIPRDVQLSSIEVFENSEGRLCFYSDNYGQEFLGDQRLALTQITQTPTTSTTHTPGTGSRVVNQTSADKELATITDVPTTSTTGTPANGIANQTSADQELAQITETPTTSTTQTPANEIVNQTSTDRELPQITKLQKTSTTRSNGNRVANQMSVDQLFAQPLHRSLLPREEIQQSSSLDRNSSQRRGNLTKPTTSTQSAASNEKRLNALRSKMDSCLTAITNKVTEKPQRSPHAPFLAYLGTKLQKVPEERIKTLEREILDLVDHNSNE